MMHMTRISSLAISAFFVISVAYVEIGLPQLICALSGIFFAFYSVVLQAKGNNKKRGFILKGKIS